MPADGSAVDTQRFFHITVLKLGDQTQPSDFSELGIWLFM